MFIYVTENVRNAVVSCTEIEHDMYEKTFGIRRTLKTLIGHHRATTEHIAKGIMTS